MMKPVFTILAVTMFSVSAFVAQSDNTLHNAQQFPGRQISPTAPPGHTAPVTGTPSAIRQTTRMLPAVQPFAAGSDKLSEPSESLGALATRLRSISTPQTVNVMGYTDDRGDATDNTLLSIQRAQQVQKYLVKKAPQHRYIITGKGGSDPVADNNLKEGRKKNNRVTASIQMDRV